MTSAHSALACTGLGTHSDALTSDFKVLTSERLKFSVRNASASAIDETGVGDGRREDTAVGSEGVLPAFEAGERSAPGAAWYYPRPAPPYAAMAGYIAVYPGRMDACYVDGERVTAQPGDFYGGWITSDIVGPFKGAPGTWGW